MLYPEFIIFTGPMFGGKTTRLLSEAERYRYQKKRFLAYKPLIDDRYDSEHIVTHNGFKLKAKRISSAEDILEDLDEYQNDLSKKHIIIIDEAFMIPNIGNTLVSIFKRNHTILISTLQLSSSCNAFDEISKVLPWATKIEICPAVCSKCSNDAFYTYRHSNSEDEIQIGGSDMYSARCFNHHPLLSGYIDE